jgi:hypothetical protein
MSARQRSVSQPEGRGRHRTGMPGGADHIGLFSH